MIELIPVRLESGLVVWHTREEYKRLWKDVDGEAAAAMYAPIELDEPPSWLPEPDEDYRPRNPAWQCMNCGSIRCDGERCSDRREDEDV